MAGISRASLARGRDNVRLAVLGGAVAGYGAALLAAQITGRALPGQWHCIEASLVPSMVRNGSDSWFGHHATAVSDRGIWFWSFAEAGWVEVSPNADWPATKMDLDPAASAGRYAAH